MRNTFVTGVTGTIGSTLVPRLLADEGTSVTLLIRARDETDLDVRRQRMLDYWGFAAAEPVARRIRVVRGDIALPWFGLAERTRDRLLNETTHVVHCAASVNLNMPLDAARASAVAPTRTLLEMAHLGLQAGALRKLDVVSTVGVWGRAPGTMPERPLPEVASFHNTYEQAKAEAERLVWAEGAGLPVTVHRPSMVVGETGSGRVIHFQIFYHLCEFLSGTRTYGIMPTLGSTRLDIVPVDWVAAAIDWSSRNPQTAGAIFHLCSGPEASIPLGELQRWVRRAWQHHGLRVPRLHTIDHRLLERLVPFIGAVAGAKARRALRALPPVLAYLAESQAFDNERSQTALADAGLPLPSIGSYLDAVLGFYLDSRTARA